MKKVIAALDNSAAASPVLMSAMSFAELLGAEVEAVHVKEDGDRTAQGIAAAAGVPLRTLGGETVAALARVTADGDVVALVIGACRAAAGARPVGTTALAVARSAVKPLLVVPPDVERPRRLRSVLVPLEGTIATSLAVRSVITLADAGRLDVVAVHVREEASMPAFTDQLQYEVPAWEREFLARYWPLGVDDVRLDVRVGVREQQIVRAAEEHGVDLIILAWSQELGADHALVVRAALSWGRVSILLIPLHVADIAAQRAEREESWNKLPSLRA